MENNKKTKYLVILENLCRSNGIEISNLKTTASEVKELEMFFGGYPILVGLKYFDHLVCLRLFGQEITNLVPLKEVSNSLRELWICEGKLKDLTGVDSCKQLVDLYLYDNQIRNTKPLEALQSLEKLWISSNKITHTKFLSHLPNLTDLNLARNDISSNCIAELDPWPPKLDNLDLSGNPVDAFQDLYSLAKLSRLTSLSFGDTLHGICPIARSEYYISWIAFHFPHLKFLDGRPIAEEIYKEKARVYLILYIFLGRTVALELQHLCQVTKLKHQLQQEQKDLTSSARNLRENLVKHVALLKLAQAKLTLANADIGDLDTIQENLAVWQERLASFPTIYEASASFIRDKNQLDLWAKHRALESSFALSIPAPNDRDCKKWFDKFLASYCCPELNAKHGIADFKLLKLINLRKTLPTLEEDEYLTNLRFVSPLPRVKSSACDFMEIVDQNLETNDGLMFCSSLYQVLPADDGVQNSENPQLPTIFHCLIVVHKDSAESSKVEVKPEEHRELAGSSMNDAGNQIVETDDDDLTTHEHLFIPTCESPKHESIHKQVKADRYTSDSGMVEFVALLTVEILRTNHLHIDDVLSDAKINKDIARDVAFLNRVGFATESTEELVMGESSELISDDTDKKREWSSFDFEFVKSHVWCQPELTEIFSNRNAIEKLCAFASRPILDTTDTTWHLKITGMDLRAVGLQSIAALDFFKYVKWLNLDQNRIVDPRPLLQLNALTDLSMESNEIKELPDNFFLKLNKLENLNLARNHIQTLTFPDSSVLKTIDCSFNNIASLRGLRQLKELDELHLAYNDLQSFSEFEWLKDMAHLHFLDLTGNVVAADPKYRLYVLYLLKTLETLDLELASSQMKLEAENVFGFTLSFDYLKNHFFMENVAQMTVIRVVNQSLHTVSFHKDDPVLNRVTEIDLSNNKLKAFEDLVLFVKLRKLNLDGNCIRATTTVPLQTNGSELALPNLTVLSLKNNGIKAMDTLRLDQLASLRELYLAQNQIQKIQGLNGLSKLETLDLSQNRIRNLDPQSLVTQRNLKTLLLDHNRLRDVSNFESLVTLEILDISSNQIQSSTALSQLGALSSLKELNCAGNAVSQRMTYRSFVISRLAALKVLDNKRISSEERESATEETDVSLKQTPLAAEAEDDPGILLNGDRRLSLKPLPPVMSKGISHQFYQLPNQAVTHSTELTLFPFDASSTKPTGSRNKALSPLMISSSSSGSIATVYSSTGSKSPGKMPKKSRNRSKQRLLDSLDLRMYGMPDFGKNVTFLGVQGARMITHSKSTSNIH